MSVDNIKNAILGDAQKEADRIKRAAEQKAEKKYRQAEARLQQDFEARVRNAEEAQQAEKNRAIISLRGSLSTDLLKEKNSIVEKLFNDAQQKVIELPDNGYKKLLQEWLKDAAPDESAELILNRKDREAFGKDLVESINEDRSDDKAITLSEEKADIAGGFILRTFKFEIDKSLDSVIAGLKEEMAPQIAAELFGGRVERL